MSSISRRWVFLKYGTWTKFLVSRIKYQMHTYNEDNVKKIQDFLVRFDTNIAATFVGLRQMKYSLGFEDPYLQTINLLRSVYSSLVVPTFTYSVRKTGMYNVTQTQSDLGVFSQLFMKNADFRSLAPIKSYAVMGPASEEFAALDYLDDYESSGSYEYFGTANAVTINIGTDLLRPVRTHQVEYLMKVPYREKIWRQLVIVDQSGTEQSSQVSDLVLKGIPVKLNNSKWERDLLRSGFLHHLRINDLLIRVLPDQSYVDFFIERLKKNPYYLVD